MMKTVMADFFRNSPVLYLGPHAPRGEFAVAIDPGASQGPPRGSP
jgi:hypothetical protein